MSMPPGASRPSLSKSIDPVTEKWISNPASNMTPAPIWNIKYRIPAAKALSVLLAHIRNTEATAATSKNMNKVIISPAKTAAIAPPA